MSTTAPTPQEVLSDLIRETNEYTNKLVNAFNNLPDGELKDLLNEVSPNAIHLQIKLHDFQRLNQAS